MWQKQHSQKNFKLNLTENTCALIKNLKYHLQLTVSTTSHIFSAVYNSEGKVAVYQNNTTKNLSTERQRRNIDYVNDI